MARRLNLDSRLTAIERRLAGRNSELRGSYTDHFIGAWPPEVDDPTVQRCTEHADCAVRVTPIFAPIHRVILGYTTEIPPRE
jgi:hypothetical protein